MLRQPDAGLIMKKLCLSLFLVLLVMATVFAACGDGVMVYWHPDTQEPLGSLTLEANRDGIEDFQLLRMAEELLGKEEAMAYAERITTAVNVYIKDADELARVRTELGDAVETALRQS